MRSGSGAGAVLDDEAIKAGLVSRVQAGGIDAPGGCGGTGKSGSQRNGHGSGQRALVQLVRLRHLNLSPK